MNLDYHDDATDESRGYQAKGYELHSEKIIKCPNCQKDLATVIVVKKDCPCIVIQDGTQWQTLRVRAKCLTCKVVSPNIVYERCKIFYQAVSGKAITDIDMNTPGFLTLDVK